MRSYTQTFNEQTAQYIKKQLLPVIQSTLSNLGVVVTLEEESRSENELKFGVKLVVADPNETNAMREASDYDKHRATYNLPPRFSVCKSPSGRLYKILGWKRKTRKYHVIVQDVLNDQIKNADVLAVQNWKIESITSK